MKKFKIAVVTLSLIIAGQAGVIMHQASEAQQARQEVVTVQAKNKQLKKDNAAYKNGKKVIKLSDHNEIKTDKFTIDYGNEGNGLYHIEVSSNNGDSLTPDWQQGASALDVLNNYDSSQLTVD